MNPQQKKDSLSSTKHNGINQYGKLVPIKRTEASTNLQKDEQYILHAEHLLELSDNQMSPQKVFDTYGLYSDDTEIYNLENINNSSETLIESTDTELYKLDENVIDSSNDN